MDRFKHWLYQEPVTWQGVVLLLIGSLLLQALYVLVVIYPSIESGLLKVPSENGNGIVAFIHEVTPIKLIVVLMLTMALEEIIFRLPLAVAARFLPFRWIMLVALTLSTAFGYVHAQMPGVAIQGVGGFIMCLLFLKCGGLNKKITKPYFVCLLSHTLWNGGAFFIMYLPNTAAGT